MPDKILKPCPFCGSEPQIMKGLVAGLTMIVCTKCRATVSFAGGTQKETVKAWNRRAGNEI